MPKYYRRSSPQEVPKGPHDVSELVSLISRGVVGANDQIAKPGETSWVPIREVPEFAIALAHVKTTNLTPSKLPEGTDDSVPTLAHPSNQLDVEKGTQKAEASTVARSTGAKKPLTNESQKGPTAKQPTDPLEQPPKVEKNVSSKVGWVLSVLVIIVGTLVGRSMNTDGPASHISEDRFPEKMTTELRQTGASDVDSNRVAAFAAQEWEPLVNNPLVTVELDRLMREQNITTMQQASEVGRAWGQRMSAEGIPLLSTEKQREIAAMRLWLAQSSPQACATMSTGVHDSPAFLSSLAQLPDAQLRQWFRLSTEAVGLRVAAQMAPQPPSEAALNLALRHLNGRLIAKDRLRMAQVLESQGSLSESDSCFFMRTLLREMAVVPPEHLRTLTVAFFLPANGRSR